MLLFVPAVIAAIGVVINPANWFVTPLEGGYVERPMAHGSGWS